MFSSSTELTFFKGQTPEMSSNIISNDNQKLVLQKPVGLSVSQKEIQQIFLSNNYSPGLHLRLSFTSRW